MGGGGSSSQEIREAARNNYQISISFIALHPTTLHQLPCLHNNFNYTNSPGNAGPLPLIRFPIDWFHEMLSVSSLQKHSGKLICCTISLLIPLKRFTGWALVFKMIFEILTRKRDCQFNCENIS